MLEKSLFIKKLLYILAVCLLLFGLLSLLAYAFMTRWPWPQLFSTNLTTQTFKKLVKQGLIPILTTSIALSLACAFISSFIALACSRALAFENFFGKQFFRLLLWGPLLIPATSYFIGLESLFTKWGIADSVLGVMISHCIVILPYAVFTLENAWQAIGLEFEEQATSLGASPLRAFFEVGLPLISPALVASIGLGFVISFGQYFLTLMIGGGQVKTFAIFAVPYMEGDNRMLAAASSLLFILICGATYFLCLQLLQKSFYDKEINEE